MQELCVEVYKSLRSLTYFLYNIFHPFLQIRFVRDSPLSILFVSSTPVQSNNAESAELGLLSNSTQIKKPRELVGVKIMRVLLNWENGSIIISVLSVSGKKTQSQ